MRALPTLLALAAAATTLIGPALAQKKPPSQSEINRAIARGVEHLRTTQTLEGRWTWTGRGRKTRPGATALALYAMLKSGVPADDPAVLRAAAALEGMQIKSTYDSAAAILAFVAHGRSLHDERIAALTAQLVREQFQGYWGYPSGGDLSNTQYAVIALWAASGAGYDVPRSTWEALLAALPRFENDSGGFNYSPGGRSNASDNMTAAGLACLDVCRARLGGSFEDLPNGSWARRAKKRALRVLDKGYRPDQFSRNSRHGVGYYIYGIERVGALCGIDELGPGHWYDVGARFLLKHQAKDGSWKSLYAGDLGTAYALLFLSRATARAVETGPKSTARPTPVLETDPETEALVALARDFGRNLVPDALTTTTVSSQEKGHLISEALDGDRGTWWQVEKGDEAPTVTIDFQHRPVTARTIALGEPIGDDVRKLGRPSSAIVLINGEILRRGTFPENRLERCRITLPAAVRIHSLEVRLVRAQDGKRTPLGLAEIELLGPDE